MNKSPRSFKKVHYLGIQSKESASEERIHIVTYCLALCENRMSKEVHRNCECTES